MRSLRLVVVGPGRAGGSLALAAVAAGHRLAGVLPGPSGRIPEPLRPVAVDPEGPLPECDLCLLTVTDTAIAPVSAAIADRLTGDPVVAHVSGFTPLDALDAVRSSGRAVGSLHPLQSLPDPVLGASSLAGAWAAVTGSDEVVELLDGFARSLGMNPFVLDDAAKAAYHAAASAASNFVVATLAVAERLADAAAVPFGAYRPLTESVVDNVFALGSAPSLTGPVARGDEATVAGQLAAADAAGVGDGYRRLVALTAELAGLDPGRFER